MKKLFVIFTILFAAFNTTAWADDKKEIKINYKLSLPEQRCTSASGRIMFIYDEHKKCEIKDQEEQYIGTATERMARRHGIDHVLKDTEGVVTLICPKDMTELTLFFDFNNGRGTAYNDLYLLPNDCTAATFIKTYKIPTKKLKITEKIETVQGMQTRLTKEAANDLCNKGTYRIINRAFCCVYGITSDSQKDALQNALNKIAGPNGLKYVDPCPDDTNNEVKKQTETPNTITVTGTVKDETGTPLIGASVKHNRKYGVVTDTAGKFTTNVPQGTTLEISYVGYKTETVTATTDQMNIVLEEVTQKLDEFVFISCRPDITNGIAEKKQIENGCYPTACVEPRWILVGDDTAAKCVQQKCEFQNGTGEWVLENTTWKCELDSCDKGFREASNGSGCIKILEDCTNEQKQKHPDALSTGIQEETNECIATECKCRFDLNNGQCVTWAENAPCDDKLKLPLNATAGIKACDNEKKAYCKITACKDGYNHNEETNTCDDLNKQPCTHPDQNATDAEYKKIDDKNVCVITKCKTGYDPSNDGQSCKPRNVLSQKDSQRKIDELTKNAQAMRDKEQSTENKLLGAAGIGATGIGGMQIMSAMAEQSADQDAETAMRAYLATFHCNYGGGMNVAGGETDVELPGGNELVGLYSEYVNLANDLKVRKAALGLRPGIESETILDSATSGLYDDVAIGKTSGAYASLARAMADPNGADAAAWAAQKSETADKLKTGAIVAGIGAIGSLAGNLALNSGDAKKEKSSEIESKYEKLKQPFQALEETINNLTPPPVPDNTCPDDATGTYPNCICNDINNPWYNDITKKCEECPNNLVYKEVEKKCGCLNDKDYVVTRDNRCVKIDQDKCPGDNFAYYEKNQTCECINGFEKTDDGTKCECPRTTHHIEEGKEGEKCVRNANPTPENQNPNNTITINLPSDSLFEFTKSELTKEAQTALKTFTNKLNQENVSCPLTIEGYTDCSGTDKLNQELSKARAEAVKKYLTETINPSPIIDKDTTIKGHGEDYCNCGVLKGGVPKDKKNHEDYKQCVGKTANYTNNHKLRFAPCRKVVITVDPNKCENKPGAQITFKEFENVISDAQELLKNKTKK